jgi:predicted PurR-regulated permease PerM
MNKDEEIDFSFIRNCLFLAIMFMILSAMFFGGDEYLKLLENAFQYGTFIIILYAIVGEEQWLAHKINNKQWSAYCFITIFILLSLGWFFTTITWTIIWLTIYSVNKQNQTSDKKQESYGGND